MGRGSAVSLGTSRDTTARIRILACEPELPAAQPRSRSWPIWALVVATAAAGAGVTWTLLQPDAGSMAAASPPVAHIAMPAAAKASANIATFRTNSRVARRIGAAVSADLPAAARYAKRTIPVFTAQPPAATPTTVNTWTAPTTGQAPQPAPASAGTSTSTPTGPSVTIREDVSRPANQTPGMP